MSFLVYKVSKKSQNNMILDRVSLYVPTNSLVALLGPSGSGKSSLLRVIAGLDFPTSGEIWLNGIDVTNVPTQYRKLGFVFQNFALFKHMNVKDNVCFGLKLRNVQIEEMKKRMDYLFLHLDIKELSYQYPSQLSGGQKQRVALARSLIIQPNFLLLDEPFGALDAELKRRLSKWLKNYLKDHKITAIMVTHDQKEAMTMADEILVLEQGHLVQQDKPQLIYDNPINRFVGDFLGSFIEAPNQNSSFKSALFASDATWSYTLANRSVEEYNFFLRPHELCLQSELDAEASPAIIEAITYKRDLVQLQLLVPNFEWKITLQIGYSAFQALSIHFVTQFVYIKPRPKVVQRAYPVEKTTNGINHY